MSQQLTIWAGDTTVTIETPAHGELRDIHLAFEGVQRLNTQHLFPRAQTPGRWQRVRARLATWLHGLASRIAPPIHNQTIVASGPGPKVVH